MSKKNKVFVVSVKVEAGSDFQYECALETCDIMLKAYKLHTERRHKKNGVRISFTE